MARMDQASVNLGKAFAGAIVLASASNDEQAHIERSFDDFVKAAKAVGKRRAAEMKAAGFNPPTFAECLKAEDALRKKLAAEKFKPAPARITGGLGLGK